MSKFIAFNHATNQEVLRLVDQLDVSNLQTDHPLCIPGGRLTVSATNTVANGSSMTTLFYLPHSNNLVPLWDSTINLWRYGVIPEAGATLPNLVAGSAGNFDLFASWTSGAMVINAAAWSSATARTTALTRKHGIWVNSSTATYLGTVRMSGSAGNTRYNDAEGQRFVWNCYNQVEKRLYRTDTTASWTYASATVRNLNGSTANRVEVLDGLGSGILSLNFTLRGVPATVGAGFLGGFGFDSTTVITNGAIVAASVDTTMTRPASQIPGLGYHFAQALEGCYSAATVTFYGAGQSALEGSWLC